jgi:hypothetical protein
MVDNSNKYNKATLYKILTAYNKSVRKRTYSGLGSKSRSELETIIRSDFTQISKGENKTRFKHKSGRFSKIVPHDK